MATVISTKVQLLFEGSLKSKAGFIGEDKVSVFYIVQYESLHSLLNN